MIRILSLVLLVMFCCSAKCGLHTFVPWTDKPDGWDEILPGGLKEIRSDGFRIVPDLKLTPGAVAQSTELITTKRNVPEFTKQVVLVEYGYTTEFRHSYVEKHGVGLKMEVDHDISLCLGGSNEPSNLWAQPYFGAYNAHDKDRLENYLCWLVKDGFISVAEAQLEIQGYHWVWSYQHYFGDPASIAEGE